MKEELRKNYDIGNDIFGYPQRYKGLELHPIKIKDVKIQNLFYDIFAHPKNYIPNKDVLKASYLKFLVYVVQSNKNPNGNEIIKGLTEVMAYITKVDMGAIDILVKQTDGEGLASVSLILKIGKIIITEEDFDDIREMVLEQNGLSIDYIEDYNPELEEYLVFENRRNSDLTFEDEIFTFCSILKRTLKEVEDYTIYQFKNHFEKLLTLKEYDLYKPLLAGGTITLKSGDIKHYLYHSVRGRRYDSILMKREDFDSGTAAELTK